jgi:hypothetical protein
MAATNLLDKINSEFDDLQRIIFERFIWAQELLDDNPIYQEITKKLEDIRRLHREVNEIRAEYFDFMHGGVNHEYTVGEMKEIIQNSKNEISDSKRILTDWQRLQTHLNVNPAAMNEWKRFMMTLRLTGGDNNISEEE